MSDDLDLQCAANYQKPRRGGPGLKRLAVGLLVLAGCQSTTPTGQEPAGPTAPPPEHGVETPALPQGTAYEVDESRSEARVLVYRGGPLAGLGHNHVIVAPLRGELRVGSSSAAGGFHLEIRVDQFEVDPPAPRSEEGEAFETVVSDKARSGTRDNMLGEKLLDAREYPLITIDSVALAGPRWNPDVTADVTLRGMTRQIKFPAAVVESGDMLTVIARMSLAVSDFGIEPFSVLGGGLQVEDRIDVRVRLTAQRRDVE